MRHDPFYTNREDLEMMGKPVWKGIVLCLGILMLSVLCGTAATAETANPDSEFAYYVAKDHVEILAYIGQNTNVVVPETIQGKPVTVVQLGSSYYDSDGPNYYFQNVRRIVLPSTVKKLGSFAFGNYSFLEEVVGLEYVQELGREIFWFVPIREAVFSSSLKKINSLTFNGSDLTHITMPDDVEIDGGSLEADKLEELTLLRGSGTPTLKVVDHVVFSGDGKTLLFVTNGLKKNYYAIPEGTETVAASALNRNVFVDEYEFPVSVQAILYDASQFRDQTTVAVHSGSYAHTYFESYNEKTEYHNPVHIRVLGQDGEESTQALVDRIVSQVIHPGMSDLEKARALHDWICDHGSYDYTYTNYEAFNILTGGEGVCDAYARAYCVLLDAVGIESRRIECVLGGNPHAINAVRISGEWCLVDVTNDDEGNGYPDYLFGFNEKLFRKLSYSGTIPVQASTLKYYAPYADGRLKTAVEQFSALIQAELDAGNETFLVDISDAEEWAIREPTLREALCVLMEQQDWTYRGQKRQLECMTVEGGQQISAALVSDDAYLYTENEDQTITLTHYLGSESKVVVPSAIRGKKVTALEGTFRSNQEVTCVILPEGIRSIGGYTFFECKYLQEVNFPSTLEEIGDDAFCLCERLTTPVHLPESVKRLGHGAFDNCTSIREAILPGSVETIGNGVFHRCVGLINVTLQEGFPQIPDGMFVHCENLKQITLPESIRSIGLAAFMYSGVVSIYLPDNVAEVSPFAFLHAEQLEALSVSEDNPYFYARDGMLFSKGSNELVAITDAADVNVALPDGTTAIRDNVFCLNDHVKSLYIPSSVKTIGDYACQHSIIEEVYMEDGVEKIGKHAFAAKGTTSIGYYYVDTDGSILRTIRLSNCLKEIGEGAFLGNNALEKLVLPDSLTRIDTQIYNFPQELYVPPTVTYIAHQEMLYDWGENIIHGIPGTYAEEYARVNGYKFVDDSHALQLNVDSVVLVENEKTSTPLYVIATEGQSEVPDASEIVWSSSDPCVQVENGILTAVATGHAVITAQWKECSGSCEVEVPVLEPGCMMNYIGNLDPDRVFLVGGFVDLYAAGDATYSDGTSQLFYWGKHAQWIVSNPSVMRVEPYDDEYMNAFFIGPGNCTVTATLPTGQSASMKFRVAGPGFQADDNSDTEVAGDVNGDQVFDGRDVVRFMKYLAGEIDPETGEVYAIIPENADLNEDGEVDERDLLRMVKALVE